MGRIIHFELPSNDIAASRKFYEEVLGWSFFRWEGPMEYWLVSTGDKNAPGIDGALGGAANEFKATVNTAEVDDLDAALEKVQANGGQIIMPKDEIPGVGFLAYVREPGGGVLGLIQNFPNSAM